MGNEVQTPGLTDQQRAAHDLITDLALHEHGGGRFATIRGFAGTGKTYTVGKALANLADLQFPGSVCLCAPTHKAVKVLEAKTGAIDLKADFVTVHKLLGLQLEETDEGTTESMARGDSSVSDYDLVIVDEASMMDDVMFARFRTLAGRANILFVGDPAQLNPISNAPGEQSRAFDETLVPEQVELTEVIRQAQENPIIRVATMCRQRIAEGRQVTLDDIATKITAGDEKFMTIESGNLWSTAKTVSDALTANLDVRALAFDNNSVDEINRLVHDMERPDDPYPFSAGEPLIAQDTFQMFSLHDTGEINTERGTRKLVYNSELLYVIDVKADDTHPKDITKRPAYSILVETENGEQGVCFVPMDQTQYQKDIGQLFGEARELRNKRDRLSYGEERNAMYQAAKFKAKEAWALKKLFSPIRHAYAMTVHKSQGSTFGASVIYWPSFQKCRDIADRNRLAYVALTRTSEYTVVTA